MDSPAKLAPIDAFGAAKLLVSRSVGDTPNPQDTPMKLASYRLDGEATFGAVVGDGVVTLGGGKCRYRTLRDALAANALGELNAAVAGKAADRTLAQIAFLPV